METAEAIEFLRTLRTVRRFTDQPVPQAVLDDLLTVARWSGSASNHQRSRAHEVSSRSQPPVTAAETNSP